MDNLPLTNNRPSVILNVAMTVDGKIDTVARQGAAISSPRDFERVDRLRADSDAVMVGGRTLLGEDPRLTVKSAALRSERRARGLEENPIKVGIVSKAEIHPDSRFLTAGPARVIIFTTRRSSRREIARLREQGAQVFVMGDRRVDLAAAMQRLAELGVKRVLVEGGGTLNAALLTQDLVDEVYLYVAPLIFGGADAPTLADGVGLEREAAIRLQLRSVENVGDGGIVVYYSIPRV
ncbi:MAG: 2,5-diamino-6-(ribosylamino)-4(3H)-pyrimidinone 5'-phosphate reductase [Anaerolineae bacterium]